MPVVVTLKLKNFSIIKKHAVVKPNKFTLLTCESEKNPVGAGFFYASKIFVQNNVTFYKLTSSQLHPTGLSRPYPRENACPESDDVITLSFLTAEKIPNGTQNVHTRSSGQLA